jgi:putative transcriptional regulator
MIKHHPSETLLTQYCAATLPASLSLAVSIHVDMCPLCQAKVEKLEASNAHAVFSDNMDVTTVEQTDDIIESSLLDMITADDSIDEVYSVEPVSISVNEHNYILPRALTRI